MLIFPVSAQKIAELQQQMQNQGVQEKDIHEQFIYGSGPGGQNKNKVATCVLLKHEPSGIEVRYGRERSQGLNRFFARRKLVELLQEAAGVRTPRIDRSEKIRKQKARRARRSKLK